MFDINKFMNSTLVPRTAEVEVEELLSWFPEGEKAIWKVRGLTATEMAKAQEAATKSQNIIAVVEAISGTNNTEKVTALKELLGTDDDVPIELAKRMEHLVCGVIAPKIELDLAVKLAQNYPIVFMTLAQKILTLTGLGAVDTVK